MAEQRQELYGGFAGVTMPTDTFDLGEGLVLSKTYAHLFAPFMAAFSPAEPGNAHAAPWRAANGGFAFDVTTQLHVPVTFDTADWFDPLNSIWWIAAMLRIKATYRIAVPLVADAAFAEGRVRENIKLWPLEINRYRFTLAQPDVIDIDDLEWVREHWRAAGKLMHSSAAFNALVQSFDGSVVIVSRSLSLMMLWAALEAMFSPARTELRFRVSANLACYLEPAGTGRRDMQKRVAKLYDARSVAAHGGGDVPVEPLNETYMLVRRVIIKMIEERHVPDQAELEAELFGCRWSAADKACRTSGTAEETVA